MDLVCGFQAKAFDEGIDSAFTLYHRKRIGLWVIAGKKLREGKDQGRRAKGAEKKKKRP